MKKGENIKLLSEASVPCTYFSHKNFNLVGALERSSSVDLTVTVLSKMTVCVKLTNTFIILSILL